MYLFMALYTTSVYMYVVLFVFCFHFNKSITIFMV